MEENNRIIPAEISKEMKDSYIDYAMSVIAGRALPDVKRWFKTCSQKNTLFNERIKLNSR